MTRSDQAELAGIVTTVIGLVALAYGLYLLAPWLAWVVVGVFLLGLGGAIVRAANRGVR